MKSLLALVLIGIFAAIGTYFFVVEDLREYLQQPLHLTSETSTIVAVEPGITARQLLMDWQQKGWIKPAQTQRLLFRFYPELSRLQAGHFALESTISLHNALKHLVSGRIVEMDVRFIEGWTFRDVRAALSKAPLLQQRMQTLSDEDVMRVLGAASTHPEGQFFPASYRYTEKVSDLDILKLAFERMQQEVDFAWQQRNKTLPYRSAYEMQIMASIVEKETGLASERPQIAGVFVRRLQTQMRLQTDPTVIYGLGASFDGNLRKIDLQTDTPYNTYTRAGLPPTPIALPGREALLAAAKPADGSDLYFVARGDGGHAFSATLTEHNAAVRRYQLRR